MIANHPNSTNGLGAAHTLHEALYHGSTSLDRDVCGYIVGVGAQHERGTLRAGSIVSAYSEHAPELGLMIVHVGEFDGQPHQDSRVSRSVFVPVEAAPAYDSPEYWELQRIIQDVAMVAPLIWAGH